MRRTSSLLIILLMAAMAHADLTGWKIGIDPGHGGSDPGAVGPTGLQEKEVNLDASLGCRRFCVSSNAQVFMTRTTDVYLSLAARANFMNANDVDRSVCVHHNASGTPSANWHLTYVAVGYGWATSGNMAATIADRVTDFNGLSFGWSNISRPGVYEENFYMVVYTTMPSCLPEISFISNPTEEQRLYRNNYCYGNGRGIYYGLMDHLGGWADGLAGANSDPKAQPTAPLPAELHVSISPNPFNATTAIRFDLPTASFVNFEVFDIHGCRVGVGLDPTRPFPAGTHEITFDGIDLPSGIYLYRLSAGDFSGGGKMVLLK